MTIDEAIGDVLKILDAIREVRKWHVPKRILVSDALYDSLMRAIPRQHREVDSLGPIWFCDLPIERFSPDEPKWYARETIIVEYEAQASPSDTSLTLGHIA